MTIRSREFGAGANALIRDKFMKNGETEKKDMCFACKGVGYTEARRYASYRGGWYGFQKKCSVCHGSGYIKVKKEKINE